MVIVVNVVIASVVVALDGVIIVDTNVAPSANVGTCRSAYA